MDVVKLDWAYRQNPQGDSPVWWDLGGQRRAFCWNTAYRQAFFELIERLVTRYDIDGVYFDAWKIFYRFRPPYVCYCDGCRDGFRGHRTATALSIQPSPIRPARIGDHRSLSRLVSQRTAGDLPRDQTVDPRTQEHSADLQSEPRPARARSHVHAPADCRRKRCVPVRDVQKHA